MKYTSPKWVIGIAPEHTLEFLLRGLKIPTWPLYHGELPGCSSYQWIRETEMNITPHILETQSLFYVPTASWTHDEVRNELRRILGSRFFIKSARLSCFLSKAVEYLLAGKAECFKEYTVGTEVYGRSGDYDPTTDTIVRTEARRLRAKLKDYYSDPGSEQQLRINMVAGSYVPVIESATDTPQQHRASQNDHPSPVVIDPGPFSLAVICFNGKGAVQQTQDLAEDLEEEVTHELAQNRDLKVFRMFGDDQLASDDRLCYWTKTGVKFALRGSVRQSPQGPVAQLQLTTIEGMIVWSERFLYGALSKAADQIASAVCTAFFSSALLLDRGAPDRSMLRN
jgi:TolB-like protein